MSKSCAKCNDKLKRSELIVCRLFCGQYFHKDCVGISAAESNFLLKSNFNWQCDTCALINFSNFFTRFTELSQCVRELKREICSIHDYLKCSQSVPVKPIINQGSSLTDLTNNSLISYLVNPNPSTSNLNNASADVVTESVSTAYLESKEVNHLTKSLTHPSPSPNVLSNISSSPLAKVDKKKNKKNPLRGPVSNATLPIYGTMTNPECKLNVIPSNKWVHLSSFSNDTEPDSIIEYVANATNIPAHLIKCFKLIKKDAVLTELPFVNFKLSVPENKLSEVLLPSIWPAFVRVKLFVPSPKNQTHIKAKTTT